MRFNICLSLALVYVHPVTDVSGFQYVQHVSRAAPLGWIVSNISSSPAGSCLTVFIEYSKGGQDDPYLDGLLIRKRIHKADFNTICVILHGFLRELSESKTYFSPPWAAHLHENIHECDQTAISSGIQTELESSTTNIVW
jgi:hypothetical protein